jgi:hypothetical protein
MTRLRGYMRPPSKAAPDWRSPIGWGLVLALLYVFEPQLPGCTRRAVAPLARGASAPERNQICGEGEDIRV